ncbi:MAG TPA: alcohol dehydrogenase [Candidatus Cybelea sp.]|nr:alcohol dehydrogenase [Candidatus Cybelea sp.]
MQSYRVIKFGQPLEAVQEPAPAPKGSEVVLKVTGCGVCHSDVHLWDGYFDLGGGKKMPFGGEGTLPLTLGHEVAGEVTALGPEASGVKIGDRRVIFPWIGCGACSYCKSGNEHLCGKPRALGVQRHGGYADTIVVPHARYLLDYGNISTELACTFACSGLTAYSALKKCGQLSAGDPLLIIGAGGVGMAGIRLAKAVTGAAPIVADIDDRKLEAAKQAGAAETINSSAADAGKRLFAMTGGGVAAAIDFVGAEASTNFGNGALRKGGKLVIVGLFGGAFSMPIPMFPFRAITIQGSYVGSLAEMHELLALAKAGAVQPIPLATRPLSQAGATLADLKAGRIVGRVVLKP